MYFYILCMRCIFIYYDFRCDKILQARDKYWKFLLIRKIDIKIIFFILFFFFSLWMIFRNLKSMCCIYVYVFYIHLCNVDKLGREVVIKFHSLRKSVYTYELATVKKKRNSNNDLTHTLSGSKMRQRKR